MTLLPLLAQVLFWPKLVKSGFLGGVETVSPTVGTTVTYLKLWEILAHLRNQKVAWGFWREATCLRTKFAARLPPL